MAEFRSRSAQLHPPFRSSSVSAATGPGQRRHKLTGAPRNCPDSCAHRRILRMKLFAIFSSSLFSRRPLQKIKDYPSWLQYSIGRHAQGLSGELVSGEYSKKSVWILGVGAGSRKTVGAMTMTIQAVASRVFVPPDSRALCAFRCRTRTLTHTVPCNAMQRSTICHAGSDWAGHFESTYT